MAKGMTSVTTPYDERVRDFFVANRIVLRWPNEIDGVYRPGDKIFIHHEVVAERGSVMSPGLFRSVGAYSACLNGQMPPKTLVGRHSYVAPQVRIMGINHPVDWVTTHPLTFRGYGAGLAKHDFGKAFRIARFRGSSARVRIGHGVTVGQSALLRQGVSVGDGAIIRPGAIVAKDVAPYEIISGIPGRSEGLRFKPEIVERLLASAWWEFSPTALAGLPPDDPERFLDELEQRERLGAATREPIELFRLGQALQEHLAKA